VIGELSSLAGAMSPRTATLFRLDKAGNVPIEPLGSIAPGFTPFRATLDLVESESYQRGYTATTHAIQGAQDVTSHVRPQLRRVTLQGRLSNELTILTGRRTPIPTGVRTDILRATMIEEIAKARDLVMVVTPRWVIHRMLILSISRPWSPGDGETSQVQIELEEARIVSPMTGDRVLPEDELDVGSVQTHGGGQQAGSAATAPAGAQPAGPGAPPVMTPWPGGAG